MSNKSVEGFPIFPVEESKSHLSSARGRTFKQSIMELDLNKIFHLSYSFELLKNVIEKIVDQLDN